MTEFSEVTSCQLWSKQQEKLERLGRALPERLTRSFLKYLKKKKDCGGETSKGEDKVGEEGIDPNFERWQNCDRKRMYKQEKVHLDPEIRVDSEGKKLEKTERDTHRSWVKKKLEKRVAREGSAVPGQTTYD